MDSIDHRIVLRRPIEADAVAVAAAVQFSLPELQAWMPWASGDYATEEALSWIRGELGDAHRFVIVESSGNIVGSCGLNMIDERNNSANLGYWVRSDLAGRGYATEAAQRLASFGLREAGYRRLRVMMSVRNHGSRRVAEKAGAHYEGVALQSLLLRGEYHDAHVFSFVADDRPSPSR